MNKGRPAFSYNFIWMSHSACIPWQLRSTYVIQGRLPEGERLWEGRQQFTSPKTAALPCVTAPSAAHAPRRTLHFVNLRTLAHLQWLCPAQECHLSACGLLIARTRCQRGRGLLIMLPPSMASRKALRTPASPSGGLPILHAVLVVICHCWWTKNCTGSHIQLCVARQMPTHPVILGSWVKRFHCADEIRLKSALFPKDDERKKCKTHKWITDKYLQFRLKY